MSGTETLTRPNTVEDVQGAIRDAQTVLPVGARTKPAMTAAQADALRLDMRGLSGIVEYEPAEYTITALAGTPLREVDKTLQANGQCFPFDPVLLRAGATVGGTVAAGLSGPGRLRYGGLRDFILGTRFVDGAGRLIRGGGKVVKNAAGFDFAKLLVGSMGRLGVLVDATFKVFPRPAAHTTVLARYADLAGAVAGLKKLSVSSFELIALDAIAQNEAHCTLAVRIGGAEELLDERTERLAEMVPDCDVWTGQPEVDYWSEMNEFAWVNPGAALLKVPVTPDTILSADQELIPIAPVRRYSVAGNILWLATEQPVESVHEELSRLGLSAVGLSGDFAHPIVGVDRQTEFGRRIGAALNRDGKFLPVHPL